MKKLFWTFLSLSLLFTACNKEENIPNLTNGTNELSLYGVAKPDGQPSQQGVAQNNKLWHPTATIDVRFLNGTTQEQELVKTHAREWEEYICVRFNFVESGDAEVRIAFNWQNNRRLTWSYTGTDCKFVTDQTLPTVNIANWQSAAKTPEIKKGDVLRIFGQILGLEYEYRHLQFNPMWSPYEEDVEDYWMSYLRSFVDWDEFKKYVYLPLQANKVIQTAEYDPASIMVMPIDDDWVTENPDLINATVNNTLSANDITFIQQLYPNDTCEEEDDAIVTMKIVDEAALKMHLILLGIDTELIIDWGDGTTQNVSHPNGYAYVYPVPQHTYENIGTYTVKIYGGTEDLYQLWIETPDGDPFNIVELDVTQNKKLYYLHCDNHSLTTLDLSNNFELNDVFIPTGQLQSLLLPEGDKLQSVFCGSNKLTALDFSQNPNIRTISCGYNEITSLTLPHNSQLVRLECPQNRIAQLDVSNNTSLTRLNTEHNILTNIDISNCYSIEQLYIGGIHDASHTLNIDLSDKRQLKTFRCIGASVKNIDLSNNLLLEDIAIGSSSIINLDVSMLNYLRRLQPHYNSNLENIDVSNNTLLEDLSIVNCPIAKIDVSNNTLLEFLSLSNCQITELDVSNNSNLSHITIWGNPFANNISAMTSFVESLPDRTSLQQGFIQVRTACSRDPYLLGLYNQKNWRID